ncbi:MAG: glycoside hydrolase family 172 protein [Thermofilaceae archaeon]
MLENLINLKDYRMRFVSSTHKLTEEERKFLLPRIPLDWLDHWKRKGVLKSVESESRLDYYSIEPGQKLTMFTSDEPGIIASIWITVSASDRRFLRHTILRAYWDGEPVPSVEAPIGDFFLQGHRAFSPKPSLASSAYSALVGLSSGGLFCFFPMPFSRARVEVENLGSEEIQSFYFIIGYYVGVDTSNRPRFHALWRREKEVKAGEPYCVLKGRGRGHYVGTYLYMRSLSLKPPIIGGLGYLEGNIAIIADGEPSYVSTGTEDYFLSGWYFSGGPFTAPFHGLIHKDEEKGEIAAYRFHVLDPIPFRESIEVYAPHGEFNEVEADYSSVAYWYQLEPHDGSLYGIRREDLS